MAETPGDTHCLGFDIPPYKIEKISGAAHQVVKLILNVSRFCLSLDEIEIVFDIAWRTLNAKIKEEGIDENDENPHEESSRHTGT